MATKKVPAKKTTATELSSRKTLAEKKLVVEPKGISGAYVVIDFPIESESICANHYTLRIGSSSHGYVEVSLNNGKWLPTRKSAGYWWFDLFNLSTGQHTITARLCDKSGSTIAKSIARNFKVK